MGGSRNERQGVERTHGVVISQSLLLFPARLHLHVLQAIAESLSQAQTRVSSFSRSLGRLSLSYHPTFALRTLDFIIVHLSTTTCPRLGNSPSPTTQHHTSPQCAFHQHSCLPSQRLLSLRSRSRFSRRSRDFSTRPLLPCHLRFPQHPPTPSTLPQTRLLLRRLVPSSTLLHWRTGGRS